jgi:hypothetical protein
MVDADFVPDVELYNYLKKNLKHFEQESLDSVFVVPAFQFTKDTPNFTVSILFRLKFILTALKGDVTQFRTIQTKSELMDRINKGEVAPMFDGIDDIPHIRFILNVMLTILSTSTLQSHESTQMV